MKWCCAIGFILATLGGATEVESNDPPSLEGLNPTQIEKIMIEELLEKPKKGKGKDKKEKFDFVKTVKPVLEQFKKQLLDDKNKMQKQLDDNIKTIKKCITKMKKSTKVALLEVDKKKRKKTKKKVKKCPSKKDVTKCEKKIKSLKPKTKACDELQKIGKKDVDSITELIKKWNKQKVEHKYCKQAKGETKFHYVSRLANHFGTKLKGFKKKIDELLKKKKGSKNLREKCDVIRHVARNLVVVTCTKVKNENYACMCEKVIEEKKICSIYDGCYKASVTNYKNDEKEIRKKNAAAKLEWRAVGRIECLLKVLGDKKPDPKKLEACVKGPQVSTKPLDLKYPKIPSKPACSVPGLSKKVRKDCAKGKQDNKKKNRRKKR